MLATPLSANPFSDEYWEGEIKRLRLRQSAFRRGPVKVDWLSIRGRCDDYLNVNMHFSHVKLPRLLLDGETCFSLTPMEVQSAALALHRATGHVVTLGLGLGYFALRAAAKREVTRVTVYEQEPLIIRWFHRAYQGRAELAKIHIIEGDARRLFRGVECDFVYADIYQDLLPAEVLTDAQIFRKHNNIRRYHYWGLEKVVLELLHHNLLKVDGNGLMAPDMLSYFRFWHDTPCGNGMTLRDLARPSLKQKFLEQARRTLGFPI